MRSPVVLLALACVGLTGSPAAAQPRGGMRGDQSAARHGWLSSLSAGQELARKNGKPLMVVLRCVP